jgi:hypothetical protein
VATVDAERDSSDLDRALDASDANEAVRALAAGHYSLGMVIDLVIRWAPAVLVGVGVVLVAAGLFEPAGPLVVAGAIVALLGLFNLLAKHVNETAGRRSTR